MQVFGLLSGQIYWSRKKHDSKGVEKIYGWLKEMIGSGGPLTNLQKIFCVPQVVHIRIHQRTFIVH